MSNESQKILNTFSRKLYNCRGSVPTQKLIDLLDEGRYGYSCEEGILTVITNDYVLADDIYMLVTHLCNIFKDPRIYLKKENLIQNAEVASKSDTESIMATYRDTKNWKIHADGPMPEYVHTFVFEQNYATYENRFVCSLMDVVYGIVCDKINQLSMEFETLNSKINGNNEVCVTANQFVNYAENDIDFPTIASSNSPVVKALGLLIKAKKRIIMLREQELYLACKKVGNVNLDNIEKVKVTNILSYDKNYYFCYHFFCKYLRKDPKFATPQQRYFNFVTVNLFKAITNCGLKLEDENSSVTVTRRSELEFESVDFVNDMFKLSVSPAENGLCLTASLLSDLNEGKYSIRILDTESALKIDGFFDPDEYIEQVNENKPENILREVLVTDYAHTKSSEIYYADANYANAVVNLEKFVKTCMMIAEGAIYIHSRVCPVCASRLIAPDANGYSCAKCDSIYHLFTYSAKELIWIKLLKRSDIDEEKIEQYAIEQANAVNQETVESEEQAEEIKEVKEIEEIKPFAPELKKARGEDPVKLNIRFIDQKGVRKHRRR